MTQRAEKAVVVAEHESKSRCHHFTWSQSVPFIKACINVMADEVDITDPPNIFTLCVNCFLKFFIHSHYLKTVFYFYKRSIPECIQYAKILNETNTLTIFLMVDNVCTLTRMLEIPSIRGFFGRAGRRNGYDFFFYIFRNLLDMTHFWSISYKDNPSGVSMYEVVSGCLGFFVFEFFTLKTMRGILQRIGWFSEILFYEDYIWKICKYIQRFHLFPTRLKESGNWREVIESDYIKMGEFCHIISHFLVILVKYVDNHGFSGLKSYFTGTRSVELRKALRKLRGCRKNVESLHRVHKCIVKRENMVNTARMQCSNERCNRIYLKYGPNYEEIGRVYRESYSEFVVMRWRKCSACELVYYCSRRCQKYDWNVGGHREICKYLYTKNHAPKMRKSIQN